MYKQQFNVFKTLYDKWFHLITEDDISKCIEDYGITHCKKVKEAVYVLEQINIYSTYKFSYKLDWNPTRLKSRIKAPRNNTKGKSFFTANEVKKLLSVTKNSNKRNSMYFYHAYRFDNSKCWWCFS